MRVQSLWSCAVLAAVLCASCVSNDEFGERQGSTSSGLSRGQQGLLRSAASQGEHELITTASRMAWANPTEAGAIADYASQLQPESAEQIAASVRMAVAP